MTKAILTACTIMLIAISAASAAPRKPSPDVSMASASERARQSFDYDDAAVFTPAARTGTRRYYGGPKSDY